MCLQIVTAVFVCFVCSFTAVFVMRLFRDDVFLSMLTDYLEPVSPDFMFVFCLILSSFLFFSLTSEKVRRF